MEWSLIPEVFYDFIGRVIPGVLVLFVAVMATLGPTETIDNVVNGSTSINAWWTLLLLIVSYFFAIVLGNLAEMLLDVLSRVGFRKNGSSLQAKMADEVDEWAILFYKLRKTAPAEATRLLKIQAERSMCEVLITGLSIFGLVNIWFWIDEPITINDRFWLFMGIVVSIIALWRWSGKLEKIYGETLNVFKKIMDDLADGTSLDAK